MDVRIRGVGTLDFLSKLTCACPQILIATTVSTCGALLVGTLSALFHITGSDLVMMVGSFGATSTLVFGAPAAPFSQPRCVIGGHMLSASIGIATAIVIPDFFTVAGTLVLVTPFPFPPPPPAPPPLHSSFFILLLHSSSLLLLSF